MNPSAEDGVHWAHRARGPVALAASLLVALLFLFVFLGTLGARRKVTAGSSYGVDPALAVARREAKALRMELVLAATEEPYLVLDLEGHTLLLKRQGTPLRGYPVRAASMRTRRWYRVFGGSPTAMDTIWGPGILLPPVHLQRSVILADTVSPPDPSGTVAVIPPAPEEAVPTPPHFRVVFPGGLSIRVQGEGEEEVKFSLAGRLGHWARGRPWQRERSRLELTLPFQDAGALYRSLPTGTPLMVLGPLPDPAAGSGEKG